MNKEKWSFGLTWDYYMAHTPAFFKKIGLLCMGIAGAVDIATVAFLPLPEKTKNIIVLVVSIAGYLGKFLTGFTAVTPAQQAGLPPVKQVEVSGGGQS